MAKTAVIIAQALKEEGVRYAFGIPGGEVLELLEAFRKAGIKFVLTKQELGAGFMADAAYQLTGKPGVLVATLGPGITNTTTAVAQAMQQRVVDQLGRVARPARVYVVNALPKTRSGKLLRRSLQALAEHRDPGDLSTLDDPDALDDIRRALERDPDQGG